MKNLLLIQIGELLTEALEVAKGVLVDKADQTEQLQQGVLQWRSRKQQLVLTGQRCLKCVGNDIRRLVDVAQPVRLVDNHEIPWHVCTSSALFLANWYEQMTISGLSNGLNSTLLNRRVVGFRFQQSARQEELLGQLLMPLFAKVGRRDYQDAPFALRPLLRQDKTRFDGFPEAYFVCQQRTLARAGT